MKLAKEMMLSHTRGWSSKKTDGVLVDATGCIIVASQGGKVKAAVAYGMNIIYEEGI